MSQNRIPTVECGECGAPLDEDPSADPEGRLPCPRCGSRKRQNALTLASTVGVFGGMPLPQPGPKIPSDPVERALSTGESSTVEFIQEIGRQIHDIAKEVAAFATSGEGTIFIGVDDDGTVLGCGETRERIEGITQTVHPRPRVDVQRLERNGIAFYALRVKNAGHPVYYSNSRPYVRDGTLSRPLEPNEVVDLIARHLNQILPRPDPDLDDLQSLPIEIQGSGTPTIEDELNGYRLIFVPLRLRNRTERRFTLVDLRWQNDPSAFLIAAVDHHPVPAGLCFGFTLPGWGEVHRETDRPFVRMPVHCAAHEELATLAALAVRPVAEAREALETGFDLRLWVINSRGHAIGEGTTILPPDIIAPPL